MGVCCQKNKKSEFTQYQHMEEDIWKSKAIFPDQYLKVLEQRYYALQPEYGLNLEKLSRLIPNIKSKHLLNRLLKYFNMKMEDQIDFNGICLLISKFLNAGQTGKIEILFQLYDLDNDQMLDSKEFNLFIQENDNLLDQSTRRNQNFTRSKFKTWAEGNLKLDKTMSFKIFLRPDQEKQMIEQLKDQIKNDKVYIISSKWWDNWKQYVNMATANPGQQIDDVTQKPQQEFIEISSQLWLARPGPIDNRDIAGEYEGELKLQAKQKCDFQEVGEDAWKELLSWYGITDKRLEFKRRGKFDKDGFKIEVHPTIIQAFETDANGIVQYKKWFKLKMSEDSTMHDVRRKLFQKFQIKTINGSEYLLYKMKINEDWELILDLDDNISSLNITSGTYFTLTKLKQKPKSKVGNWQLGQKSLIEDPSQRVEKMCLAQRFTEDLKYVILHIEGQSFFDDFQLEIKENHGAQFNSYIQGRSYNIKYPGLQNLGNTCYMNAALQCLINTKYFFNFLFNEGYKNKVKVNNSLVQHLSSLAKEMTQTAELSISPSVFQNALVRICPRFKMYEAQDADEFLDYLLTQISDELKGYDTQQDTVIETLFQGDYLTQKQCSSCQYEMNEPEKNKIFRLKIQEEAGVFKLRLLIFMKLKFIYDRDEQFVVNQKDLLKKTIILTKNDGSFTMRDLYEKINSILGLAQNEYEFARSYKKEFIKIFINIDENQELTKLGINQNKTLNLYQLGSIHQAEREFETISQMFNYPSQDFKLNDLINFLDPNNQWKQGKIVQVIQSNPIKYKILYRLQQQNNNQKQFEYIMDKQKIVKFREKIKHHTHEKVPLLHYYFNTFKKQYNLTLKPIILLLPIQSLSLLELKVYIYKQVSRFINITHFNVQSPFKSSNVSQQEICNFFSNPSFPYKIRVLDQNRKCLFCENIRPHNNITQSHCMGCEEDPILLNFDQFTKPSIILEWKEIKFAKILEKRKDELEERSLIHLRLQKCLEKSAEDTFITQECFSCRQNTQIRNNSYLNKPPIMLIINLQKYKSNGEQIERYIDFPLNSLDIKDCRRSKQPVLYDLYAVINNKRGRDITHYTAYVKKKDEWYEFDDSNVQKVREVQTKNAYLLFYTIQEIPEDSDISLLNFK
ncbi:unnamed protein product (macronuclear) [Paramecium tetraurelia]|uniref:Uncharacterized protein n=1 Tax=Paramecium tetraurelia TaxID=5888 RepID=A0E8K9_PARTE|nr:uncharacterized protein GSPATT00024355001 [Paramecium tetraurelia]CAK91626.1 unnamed protein product [Paramecium tetraurelia]|eukprot:XP_001459023.1 hypothetical protein (macronuclear) [Paramecium tetraurelia strain d4-2]